MEMSRLLFAPISIGAGLIAGFAAKKAFEFAWGLVDEAEPPEPETRETNWPKLIAALAVEGAIFKATRGALDHAARRSFYGATGAWPGEEQPDPA